MTGHLFQTALALAFFLSAAIPSQARIDPPHWFHDVCEPLADRSAVPQCAAYSDAKVDVLNRIADVVAAAAAGEMGSEAASMGIAAAMETASLALGELDQALQPVIHALDDPSDLVLAVDGEAEYLDAARGYWGLAAYEAGATAAMAAYLEAGARIMDEKLAEFSATARAVDAAGDDPDEALPELILLMERVQRLEGETRAMLLEAESGVISAADQERMQELRAATSADWLLPEEPLRPVMEQARQRLDAAIKGLGDRLVALLAGEYLADCGDLFVARDLQAARAVLERR